MAETQKWIAADTFPDKRGFYLCFMPRYRIHVQYAIGYWDGHVWNQEVLYWMPLPNPPYAYDRCDR